MAYRSLRYKVIGPVRFNVLIQFALEVLNMGVSTCWLY